MLRYGLFLVGILLLAFKAFGVVTWSWWIILLPWIVLSVFYVLLIAFAILIIKTFLKNNPGADIKEFNRRFKVRDKN